MRYLRRFRSRGTLVLVSHDLGAVAALCERAVWLDRGRIRDDGMTRAVCHRYLAASMAERDDPDRFRLPESNQAEAVPGALRPPVHAASEAPPGPFTFDPDSTEPSAGGAKIERVAVGRADSSAIDVLEGGEEILIEAACKANRKVGDAVAGFALRDNMGQAILCEHSALAGDGAPWAVASGAAFRIGFRFRLPYLPTGTYALSLWLFDAALADGAPLDQVADGLFLSVQSHHVSGGLANVAMRATTLSIGESGAAPS